MKKDNRLFGEMFLITTLPMLILGLVIIILSFDRYKSNMYLQIKKELNNMSIVILNTYDMQYKGDYYDKKIDGKIHIYKGDTEITGNNGY